MDDKLISKSTNKSTNKSIDKSKLNLSIDMILLLLMMPIAGIGFLMKWVLISGINRNPIYGNNVDLEFLGLSRHQWGTIHLFLSITFLVLLILHIYFHWKMIVIIFRRMIPGKTLCYLSAILLTVVSLLMVSFPLFVKPEIVAKEVLHHNRNNNSHSESPVFRESDDGSDTVAFKTQKQAIQISEKNHNHHANEEYEVNGSETLQFVADRYNVPASRIAADLKVPERMTGEKLGRLKKRYLFTMDDVRNSISKNKR